MSVAGQPTDAPRRVLIAGAGPVAMTAALLLARWGVATVLLEAKPARDGTGSKAICFQRDVLDIFDRVGVAEAAVAEGVTWWHGLTFYRDHELFETTFPETGQSGFPPFINVSQTFVEDLLWARVTGTPLIDVRLGHRVIGLEQDETGVAVTVESERGTTALHGPFLLGCDGGGSAVRKLLGLPFPGHSFAEQFLIADIRAELPFPNERRFYFDPQWNPGRQVLVHPQPNSTWRIDWQVPADFDLERERADGALDARIRRITGDAPYEIEWVSVYRFHQRVVPEFRVGRVLLAGDAAHLYAPFGARGLNSGAQDADNAAWKIVFALRGWAGDLLLDSYHLERWQAAQENLRVTNETMRFLVPQGDEEWARRRTLLDQAVADPEARALVDSGKLAEPYWYLDSPLTTPDGDSGGFPREAAVDRPVVPGVLCPDCPCTVAGRHGITRLRRLFGDGLVVLAHGVDPEPLRVAVAGVGPPVQAYRMEDIGAADGGTAVATALAAPVGTAVLVRPDGHIAARVEATDPAALATAARRACGQQVAA